MHRSISLLAGPPGVAVGLLLIALLLAADMARAAGGLRAVVFARALWLPIVPLALVFAAAVAARLGAEGWL